MLRWLAVVLALSGGAALASPVGRDSNYNVAISSGAAYTGPGDVVGSASHFWGLRCYATATSGNLADVVDAATGNTTGTRLQCSSGGTISALVSGSACTFVTGNACSTLATTCASACNIVTLYDQVGSVNLTQATNSARPAYGSTSLGGKPGMSFNSTNSQVLANASFTATAQPWTFTLALNATSGRLGMGFSIGVNPGGAIASGTTFPIYDITGHTLSAAFTSGSPQYVLGVWNGASSAYNSANANVTGQTLDTSSFSAPVDLGADNYGFGTGVIGEFGIWPLAFSTTQLTNMRANMAAFY